MAGSSVPKQSLLLRKTNDPYLEKTLDSLNGVGKLNETGTMQFSKHTCMYHWLHRKSKKILYNDSLIIIYVASKYWNTMKTIIEKLGHITTKVVSHCNKLASV